MKWIFFRYSVACYVYFSKLPKANNVKERNIALFAVQSSNLTTESGSNLRAAKTNVLITMPWRTKLFKRLNRYFPTLVRWNFHYDIYPSLSDILLAKKWQTLKQSLMAIHIATEAKWGKQNNRWNNFLRHYGWECTYFSYHLLRQFTYHLSFSYHLIIINETVWHLLL